METEVELTTMCMITYGKKVLMINRVKSWKGWSFPGGHLEQGESLDECVRREVYEETGIVLSSVRLQGIINLYNLKTGKRYFVFSYIANEFTGSLKSGSSEGLVEWKDIAELNELELAQGMNLRLPIFFDNRAQELYIEHIGDDYYRVERHYL